jgi:hypothetical protein
MVRFLVHLSADFVRASEKTDWTGVRNLPPATADTTYPRTRLDVTAVLLNTGGFIGIGGKQMEIPMQELKQEGTSHHLSSRFLAFEAGVKQRSIFQHGAGNLEGDGHRQCGERGHGCNAGFQCKILGFALLIGPSRGIRQVVYCIP